MDDLHSYLNNRIDTRCRLYHYTNYSTLIKILKSGMLLVNNIKNVNDALEADGDAGHNVYVASFTYEQREAVHYWAVYGRNDPYSVRISFVCDESQDHFMEGLRFTDQGLPVEPLSKRLSDVIYYSSTPSRGRHWKHDYNYFSLDADIEAVKREFSGLCKYDIWEHEKETRLLVLRQQAHDRIFAALPSTFFASLEVVFSPWIDEEVQAELAVPVGNLLAERYGVKDMKSVIKTSSIHSLVRLK
jgi:hypothetical protein